MWCKQLQLKSLDAKCTHWPAEGIAEQEACHWDGVDARCSPVAVRRKCSSTMAFSFLLCLLSGMAVGRKDQGLVQGYRFSMQTSSRAHSKDVCRHRKARLFGDCCNHCP